MTLTPLPGSFDLDSQTLRVVAAVAEYGSITRAAAVLGYSQPAVSQQLKRVEARIGMPLVTRSGRGIRLTDAGEVLARHADAVLTALDAAAGELSDLSGLRSGRVRLAAFPSASSTIVPRLIGAMAADHAGVQFTYLEAEPPEAVAGVRDGVSDLAIAFRHPADRHDPFDASAEGLVVHELARDDVLLLAPAGHPGIGSGRADAGGTGTRADGTSADGAVDLAALRGDNWIAGCPRCRGHLLDSCARAGFAPSISFETDNFVAVMSMVAAGLGVALLPELAISASALPPGVEAHRTRAGDHRMLVAVTRPGAEHIPAVAETLRLLTTLTLNPIPNRHRRPSAPREVG
ncbi:LysR family transcriptional regulator [Herbiconiux sp. VKM Ac-1786]|uniref:LysR family transcriptional regulator n=1 Tax=Herbiconiux sp. VKM Ac-1786 TaxID=2783824 RepID=UPI00188CB502|nr:LysR family transcriptional regulator [Herbiconiux sp. VKM Ac-1786]MBF4572205.1 LysR family transcriptional regulator [Herbiconiux sp. VKM Ac-1786]